MQETLKGWLGRGGQRPLVCEYIGGTYQPAFVPQTADRYRYLKNAESEALPSIMGTR